MDQSRRARPRNNWWAHHLVRVTRPIIPPHLHSSSAPLDARSEALVRLLRTVLDEARQLLDNEPPGEQTMALAETILRLQQEVERIVPDFHGDNVRYGESKG